MCGVTNLKQRMTMSKCNTKVRAVEVGGLFLYMFFKSIVARRGLGEPMERVVIWWSLQPDCPQGRHLVWPIMASNIIVTSANFKDRLGPACVFFWVTQFFLLHFYLPSAPAPNKAFPYDLRKREILDFGCIQAPSDFQSRQPSLGASSSESQVQTLGMTGKYCRLQIMTGKSGDPEHHMRRSQGTVTENVSRADTGWSHYPMTSMKLYCGRREDMPVPGTLRY